MADEDKSTGVLDEADIDSTSPSVSQKQELEKFSTTGKALVIAGLPRRVLEIEVDKTGFRKRGWSLKDNSHIVISGEKLGIYDQVNLWIDGSPYLLKDIGRSDSYIDFNVGDFKNLYKDGTKVEIEFVDSLNSSNNRFLEQRLNYLTTTEEDKKKKTGAGAAGDDEENKPEGAGATLISSVVNAPLGLVKEGLINPLFEKGKAQTSQTSSGSASSQSATINAQVDNGDSGGIEEYNSQGEVISSSTNELSTEGKTISQSGIISSSEVSGAVQSSGQATSQTQVQGSAQSTAQVTGQVESEISGAMQGGSQIVSGGGSVSSTVNIEGQGKGETGIAGSAEANVQTQGSVFAQGQTQSAVNGNAQVASAAAGGAQATGSAGGKTAATLNEQGGGAAAGGARGATGISSEEVKQNASAAQIKPQGGGGTTGASANINGVNSNANQPSGIGGTIGSPQEDNNKLPKTSGTDDSETKKSPEAPLAEKESENKAESPKQKEQSADNKFSPLAENLKEKGKDLEQKLGIGPKQKEKNKLPVKPLSGEQPLGGGKKDEAATGPVSRARANRLAGNKNGSAGLGSSAGGLSSKPIDAAGGGIGNLPKNAEEDKPETPGEPASPEAETKNTPEEEQQQEMEQAAAEQQAANQQAQAANQARAAEKKKTAASLAEEQTDRLAGEAIRTQWNVSIASAYGLIWSFFGFYGPWIVCVVLWFSGNKIAKNHGLRTWQKITTVVSFFAPLLLYGFLAVFLLSGICYLSSSAPLTSKVISVLNPTSYGLQNFCLAYNSTSVGNFVNKQIGGSSASNSVGGPLSLSSDINQKINAYSNQLDVCMLKVVVQKESGGNPNIIGCDCASNGNASACKEGARGDYHQNYNFNWPVCSYGIGLTQWTIYQQGSSGYKRWQDNNTPSRTPFGTAFYTVNDFLNPDTSLQLTAQKLSAEYNKSTQPDPRDKVADAFASYVGASSRTSTLVGQRMVLYDMCKATGATFNQ